MRFQKIQQKDLWGSCQYLGANRHDLTDALWKAAKASKAVHVRFPDGTIETTELVATPRRNTVHDHGHEYAVTTTAYYAKFALHGIKVLIPVEDLCIAMEDLND